MHLTRGNDERMLSDAELREWFTRGELKIRLP